MAAKFEIENNALFVTDTVTSEVLFDAPLKDVYYDTRKLDDGNISLYDTSGVNKHSSSVFDTLLVNSIDGTDTPFTIESFRSFARLNLGKSSPQASGIIDQIQVVRLINSQSSALEQNPTGIGVSNAIQVEYGASVGTVNDDVMMDANGTLTFNKAGTYRIKIALQFGRSENPNVSVLLFRVIDVNGNQLGRSLGYLIRNSNEVNYLENDTWLTVPSGFVVKTEIMRDSSGIDEGGLVSLTPTDEGINTWNFVPTAAIRVIKLV